MTYIFNMIIRNEGISMKISAKGRYGLAAMTYLARNYASGSPVTIVSISEKLGISKIYLEQVFSLLKRARLVNSIKGSQGGYQLSRAPREITIHELELLSGDGAEYTLRVRCSKGTYVRTLCHDIGAALGCGGVMSALRRTAVGGYRVEDAHTMDELRALPREAAQRLLLPVDSLWPDAPQVTVDAKAERLARCGNPFALSLPDGIYRIYAASGEFLLLAQVTDGTAVTIKSFFEVS